MYDPLKLRSLKIKLAIYMYLQWKVFIALKISLTTTITSLLSNFPKKTNNLTTDQGVHPNQLKENQKKNLTVNVWSLKARVH